MSTTPEGPQLIALFGAGRNGSTLLQNLMDGSPDLWMHPLELNFLRMVDEVSDDPRRYDPESLRGRFSYYNYFESMQEGVVETLEGEPRPTAADLATCIDMLEGDIVPDLPAFIQAVAKRFGEDVHDRSQLAIKTLDVALLDRYLDLWPDLRCIHLFRDPVPNYASLKRTDLVKKGVPFWAQGEDLLKLFVEDRWLAHARAVERVAENDTGNLVIRYEDLLAEPDGTMSRIFDWLGCEPPKDLTLQTFAGGREAREVRVGAGSRRKSANPHRVDPKVERPGGHRDVVTPREEAFIRLRTAPEARRLGYSVPEENGTASRIALAARWALPDQWEVMHRAISLDMVRHVVGRRLYVWSSLRQNRSPLGGTDPEQRGDRR